MADDDLAVHRKRCQRRVTTRLIVVDWSGRDLPAGSRVKSDERTIGGRHVEVVAVQSDSTVRGMELKQALRILLCVTPELRAGLGVKSYNVILRRRYEHAPTVDDRHRFVSPKQVSVQRPSH